MKNSLKNQIVAACCMVVSASILIPVPTFANTYSSTTVQSEQTTAQTSQGSSGSITQTSQRSSGSTVQTSRGSSGSITQTNRSSFGSITSAPRDTSTYYPYCVERAVPIGSTVKQCLHPSNAR